jgi:hypothetical protein
MDKTTQQIERFFQFVSLLFGAYYAWIFRHSMEPDGIAYLDLADAYARSDWRGAVVGHWSPAYPFVLGMFFKFFHPPSFWEFPFVHGINFLIFSLTLAFFSFFLRELIAFLQRDTNSPREPLSPAVLVVMGYPLFLWSSLQLITIQGESADLLVAAIFYAASAILLKIAQGSAGVLSFAMLGLLLGIGYFAKTAMLPLAATFFVAALILGGIRKFPALLFSVILCALVSTFWMMPLSKAKERFTIGDSGKLTYALFLNGWTLPNHIPNSLLNSGIELKHPIRKIFDEPTIFEFDQPQWRTSYPVWYDPSYWLEGLNPKFDTKKQIRILVASMSSLYDILFRDLWVFGLAFLTLVYFKKEPYTKLRLRTLAPLYFPVLGGIAMYSLVNLQPRYIGANVTLFWIFLFAGIRIPKNVTYENLSEAIAKAISVIMLVGIFVFAGRDYLTSREHLTLPDWQVAQELKTAGLKDGDRIGYIGNPLQAYWARLARIQITANMPEWEMEHFLSLKEEVKENVLQTFFKTGVRAVILKGKPIETQNEWKQIGNSEYWIFPAPAAA